jgi:hypothetical protein
MYGEMVFQAHPGEFSPVAESAYCGAGVLHTMLVHTDPKTKVLSVFPGVPRSSSSSDSDSWGGTKDEDWDDVQFYELKALGNLAVSAVRESGATKWISLYAQTGGSFLLARCCMSL